MEKRILTNADVAALAASASIPIQAFQGDRLPRVYAIPRGGIPAAYAIGRHVDLEMVDDPQDADFIVDDLIDSGATMARVLTAASRQPTGRRFMGERAVPVALLDKRTPEWKGAWVVFPWEGDAVGSLEDNIRRTLQFIGEDPTRGGLIETPHRVAEAWQFWTGGYDLDPASILKTFEDGAEGVDEMVMVRDIPFYTHCEHHMAPFFGTATIAYVPNGKVVGLSKLSRLLDCFARRLQVQERLTTQIADALMEHLEPKGAGVIVQARHLCMESRGVRQQGHSTVTSALRGVFKEGTPRAEFLALAKN